MEAAARGGVRYYLDLKLEKPLVEYAISKGSFAEKAELVKGIESELLIKNGKVIFR